LFNVSIQIVSGFLGYDDLSHIERNWSNCNLFAVQSIWRKWTFFNFDRHGGSGSFSVSIGFGASGSFLASVGFGGSAKVLASTGFEPTALFSASTGFGGNGSFWLRQDLAEAEAF
jgi:hypothetical protein